MADELVLESINGTPRVVFRALFNQPVPYRVIIQRNGITMMMREVSYQIRLRGPVGEWLDQILPPEMRWEWVKIHRMADDSPAHLPYRLKEATDV